MVKVESSSERLRGNAGSAHNFCAHFSVFKPSLLCCQHHGFQVRQPSSQRRNPRKWRCGFPLRDSWSVKLTLNRVGLGEKNGLPFHRRIQSPFLNMIPGSFNQKERRTSHPSNDRLILRPFSLALALCLIFFWEVPDEKSKKNISYGYQTDCVKGCRYFCRDPHTPRS